MMHHHMKRAQATQLESQEMVVDDQWWFERIILTPPYYRRSTRTAMFGVPLRHTHAGPNGASQMLFEKSKCIRRVGP